MTKKLLFSMLILGSVVNNSVAIEKNDVEKKLEGALVVKKKFGSGYSISGRLRGVSVKGAPRDYYIITGEIDNALESLDKSTPCGYCSDLNVIVVGSENPDCKDGLLRLTVMDYQRKSPAYITISLDQKSVES